MNFKEHYLHTLALNESLQDLQDSTKQFNQLIAKVLLGDFKKTDEIPEPVGDYRLGVDFTVHPKDRASYTKLFTVTPPKASRTVEEDDIGTKGSGNGEIALYWLLSKNYTVEDTRGSDNPDLRVNGVGLEVKAYDTKAFTLGRFGKQSANRQLLSIAFGLKALLDNFSSAPKTSKRPPSLDTFNKFELIKAFEIIMDFDSNSDLKQIAPKYLPISNIYQQINSVVTGLGLVSGNYTAEEGAAAMLRLFLNTKLEKKPGYPGYIVNVTHNGEAKFYKVDEAHIKSLEPGKILDGIKANGAALIVNPDMLFK
jgi:hypothetical protein